MIGIYSGYEILFFCVLVVAALVVDLLAHKQDKAISMKNAAAWSVFWVLLSLGFAFYVGEAHGADHGSLFLAGYLLEKSLSVDNLFVFMAIFSSFSVREEYQHRVLYYGILGALVLRLIFVAAGTSLIALLGRPALAAFGLFVLWSAWKMWQGSLKKSEELEDYSHHWAVRLAGRFLPVSKTLDGHNFLTRLDGRLAMTPLLLCLLVVEAADVMFAFDSVPAVIAITREPFLVYTSNIFAILGLRSMYFLLAGAKRHLKHLETAVVAILFFIGVKMLLDVSGLVHITPMKSLLVVGGLLALGVAASFIGPRDK